MADPMGFPDPGADTPHRPAGERGRDWQESHHRRGRRERVEDVGEQAGRCMNCGVPFCHSGSAGCPLGNLIPEWTDDVRRGDWSLAADRLHATNNFPEFTGMVCPAPCESACVLSISPESGGPVAIKRIELAISEVSWDSGRVTGRRAAVNSGRRVAVVGSGPAGLAAAQQLTRAGHTVHVYERDDRLGGLLRYGIPEFRLAGAVLDRRLGQLRAEGTKFIAGCEIGVDVSASTVRAEYDAMVLAVGALAGEQGGNVAGDRRDRVPGHELAGVHPALEYLVAANRECEGDGPAPVHARGRHVVIIGGGRAGADCYGTAIRQGALSVTQLDGPRLEATQVDGTQVDGTQVDGSPADGTDRHEGSGAGSPDERSGQRSPWPHGRGLAGTYPADDEGGVRRSDLVVRRLLAEGAGVRAVEVYPADRLHGQAAGGGEPARGPARTLPAELVLLATGPGGAGPVATRDGRQPLLDELSLSHTGTLTCGADWQTPAEGVFVCGDARRGASLVVWAIAEGRSAAHAVDAYLMGSSNLPAPVHPAASSRAPV